MPDKIVIPNYDLFAKYFARETNTHETKELDDWVCESADNKKTFDRMYFLWMQSAKKEIEQKVESNLAWEKLQNRIHTPQKELKIVKKEQSIFLKTAKNFLKVAAVLFIGYTIGYFVDNYSSEPEYLSQETLADTVNVLLADQTSVKLNKNSKLTYPDKFKNDERKVKLKGEAYFEVTHNKEKPFIVETEIALIKVLGTSFNVKTYDTINKVTVQSGKVELSRLDSKGEKLILTKGETGVINSKTGDIIREINTIENEASLYWLDKKLEFKKTELYVVVETLSKVFNVEIILANELIKFCPLDAPFENMSLDEILDVIKLSFNLEIEKNENQIILSGDGCD